jgi:hypothetical protein
MTFLHGLKNQNFIEEQIDALDLCTCSDSIDNRQIKNILKIAQLLASSKDTPLNFGHVQTITKLRDGHACIPQAQLGFCLNILGVRRLNYQISIESNIFAIMKCSEI